METIKVLEKYRVYLEYIGLKPNTVWDELHFIKLLHETLSDNILLKIVEDKTAEALVRRLEKIRQWDPNTTRKCKYALKRFFYWGYDWEHLVNSRPAPYQNISCGGRKYYRKEAKFYTKEEIERMYSNPFISVRDAILCRFIFVSGLRASETNNLNCGDFDSKNCQVHIKKGKREKWSYVKLDPRTNFILSTYVHNLEVQGHGKPEDPMFPTMKWGRMHRNRIYKIIRRLGEFVGLIGEKRAFPHRLRHSIAREILINGGNLGHVQRHLRHQSQSQTLAYTHFLESDVEQYIEAV